MKTFITSLFFVSSLMMVSFNRQGSIDEVIIALRSGNAVELSKYFDDNVQLTLPDKNDSYSKAQALLILKDFFNINDVKGFQLKYKGDSPGGHYCVGTLLTKASNFRTKVFMKMKSGKELIKDISFLTIE